MEAFTGIGLILGPIIGSVLYTFLGFSKTFFVFGSLFVIISLSIYKVFPSVIDRDERNIAS